VGKWSWECGDFDLLGGGRRVLCSWEGREVVGSYGNEIEGKQTFIDWDSWQTGKWFQSFRFPLAFP